MRFLCVFVCDVYAAKMDVIKVRKSELQWSQNGTLVILGQPRAGKTYLINDIILSRGTVFHNKPASLVLLYAKWDSMYDNWKTVFGSNFCAHQGWDSRFVEKLFARRTEKSPPLLLIIDDLIDALTQRENRAHVLRLINVYVSHGNAVLILTTQECTMEGGAGLMLRNIIRTAAGIVIFDNVLSLIPLRSLSISLFPARSKPSSVLTKILEKNSILGFRYIFIDINASNYERNEQFVSKRRLLRVRNTLFTNEVFTGAKPLLFYT